MRRAVPIALVLALASPCRADGLGSNVVNGFVVLVLAWLGSPLLGVALAQFRGIQARGCVAMFLAYLVGAIGSTATLYAMLSLSRTPAGSAWISDFFACLSGALAGAGAAYWTIARNQD